MPNSPGLQKAMELPLRAAGVMTLSMLEKAVSGMGTLAAPITSDLKQIANPIASAFGVPNTIADRVIKDTSHKKDLDNQLHHVEKFKQVFDVLSKIEELSPEYDVILKDIISILHQISLEHVLQNSQDDRIKRIATIIDKEFCQNFLHLLMINNRNTKVICIQL